MQRPLIKTDICLNDNVQRHVTSYSDMQQIHMQDYSLAPIDKLQAKAKTIRAVSLQTTKPSVTIAYTSKNVYNNNSPSSSMMNLNDEYTEHTWTGDSGSTNNITNNMRGMYDVKDIYEPISGISGALIATKVGTKRVMIKQIDGTSNLFEINPVKYCANARTELFSILTELDKKGNERAHLSSDSQNNMVLSYPSGGKIVFDRHLRTKDGRLSGVEMIPIEYGSNYSYINGPSNHCAVALNDYHEFLGHPGEEITRRTAKVRDMKLQGKYDPCKGCLLGKARQKDVPKAPKERAQKPAERLFIDISYQTIGSLRGNIYWLLAIDDHSGRAKSFFLKKKSDLTETIMAWLELLHNHSYIVKYIRMDGGGENKALIQACVDKGWAIQHEIVTDCSP